MSFYAGRRRHCYRYRREHKALGIPRHWVEPSLHPLRVRTELSTSKSCQEQKHALKLLAACRSKKASIGSACVGTSSLLLELMDFRFVVLEVIVL